MRGYSVYYANSPIAHEDGTDKGNYSDLIMIDNDYELVRYHFHKNVTGCFQALDGHSIMELYLVENGSISIQFLNEPELILNAGDVFQLNSGNSVCVFKIIEDVNLVLLTNHHCFDSDTERDKVLNGIMSEIHKKDGDTWTHCNRVRDLCVEIAYAVGFEPDKILDLFYASRFHDVGKCYISRDILLKPAKLTEHEYNIMKGHSGFSADIVRPYFGSNIAEIVLCHHERPDGKGYPRGLTDNEIPLESKIIAVADSYDAMITVRPYNKGKTPLESMDELKRCSGTQFDPAYVDALETVLKKNGVLL